MGKVNVICRLKADDLAFLDKLAAITDRDRHLLIAEAIANYVELQRWQIEEFEHAIAEREVGECAAKEVRVLVNGRRE